nr:hypothetical protein [Methylomarinum sp. Ch1-1]MDP4519116.1 hypothetical protein [Methylomarinum sp. Ch1-1]
MIAKLFCISFTALSLTLSTPLMAKGNPHENGPDTRGKNSNKQSGEYSRRGPERAEERHEQKKRKEYKKKFKEKSKNTVTTTKDAAEIMTIKKTVTDANMRKSAMVWIAANTAVMTNKVIDKTRSTPSSIEISMTPNRESMNCIAERSRGSITKPASLPI